MDPEVVAQVADPIEADDLRDRNVQSRSPKHRLWMKMLGQRFKKFKRAPRVVLLPRQPYEAVLFNRLVKQCIARSPR